MKILFQGNGSLRLTTNENIVIYVDPYKGKGYDVPADIILVTHQHSDHNQIQKVKKKSNCLIYQNFDAMKNGEYLTKEYKKIRITGFPAYNSNHKKEECVGFIVEADNKKFYFSGDTSKIPEMSNLKKLKIDYAFLPVDGIFNMGINEALECNKIISPRYCTPIHMSAIGLYSKIKAKKFNPDNKLILELNKEIDLLE